MAKHMIEVAPESAKVVFENDVVRVIEMTMRKNQRIPLHSHNKGLSYSLNKAKVQVIDESGKSRVVNVKKGQVSWSDESGSHIVKNLGGIVRELSVEFKD